MEWKPTVIDLQEAARSAAGAERAPHPAQLPLWRRSLNKAGGSFWPRVRSVEVLVEGSDGQTYRVPIAVGRNNTLRWLALAGILALPLNWLVRRALRARRGS
jgi:hypothetical protein